MTRPVSLDVSLRWKREFSSERPGQGTYLGKHTWWDRQLGSEDREAFPL